MKVTIDGQPATLAWDETDTLGTLLGRVRGALTPKGRMAIAVCTGGERLAPSHIEEHWKAPAAQLGDLDFITESTHVVLDEAMEQADGVLDATLEQAARVADQLQQGRTSEGLQQFVTLMRQWQQVHDGVVNSISLLGMDPRNVEFGEADLVSFFQQLRTFLDQLKEIVRTRDTVLLADTLYYELEPMIDSWKQCIDAIRKQSLATP